MTNKEFIKRLNSEISSFFDDQIALVPTHEANLLLTRIKQISALGKRIRPKLLFNLYSSYGGQDDIMTLGLALELLHQTLLIHDDIIDEDISRHGIPNITGLYLKDKEDEKFSYNQALLAGDLIHNLMSNLLISQPNISRLFNDAFISAIYGQQLDIANTNNNLKDMTINKLVNISELKTASYSSILPTKIVIEILKINKKEQLKLLQLAKYFGIYIQLRNDHDDYFENAKLKDYTTGKITHPYLMGIELVSGNDLNYLINNIGNLNVDKNKLLDVLNKYKVKEKSLTLLNKYIVSSNKLVDKLDISKQDKLRLTI